MAYEGPCNQENDPHFCEDCECIIPEGGEHTKPKHLALPKGTMPYDEVEVLK
jgi:hypothetical protein